MTSAETPSTWRALWPARLRRPWAVLSGVLLLVAIAIAVLRWQSAVVLTLDNGHLVGLESLWPGATIKASVADFGFDQFEPYVRLKDLDLLTPEGMRFAAADVALSLDTFESLGRWAPVLGRLWLRQGLVELRQDPQGRWSIPASEDSSGKPDLDLFWQSDRIQIDALTLLLKPHAANPARVELLADFQNRQGDHRGRVELRCAEREVSCGALLQYDFAGNPMLGVSDGRMTYEMRGLPSVQSLLGGELALDLRSLTARGHYEIVDSVQSLGTQFDLQLLARGHEGRLPIALKITADGADRAEHLRVNLRQFDVVLGDQLTTLKGAHLFQHEDGVRLTLPDFQLQNLLKPLGDSAILSEIATRWLRQLAPAAVLKKTRVEFGQHFSYGAVVSALSVSPYRGAPEIRGAEAELLGHALGGRLRLKDSPITFGFPDMFPSSWHGARFAGAVDFWYDQGLRLRSGPLKGDTGDVRLLGRFGLHRPADPSLHALTLLLQIEGGTTDKIINYLPTQIDAPLYNWLIQAIGPGQIGPSRIAIHSYGNAQPGRRTQTELDLALQAVAFRFEKDWPRFDELNAQVGFSNRLLQAEIASASSGGVHVSSGSVNFLPDEERFLHLQVRGETETEGLLNFLRTSPVVHDAPWLHEWQGGGQFAYEFRGDIDLDGDEHRLVVDSQHVESSLTNENLSLHLSNLAGPLRYERPTHLSAPQVTGSLNGLPIGAVIDTKEKIIAIEAQGTGNGEWLENWLPWPVRKGSQGQFEYVAHLEIPDDGTMATTLLMQSDLKGFGLLLPTPGDKTMDAVRPVTFRLAALEGRTELDFMDAVVGFKGEMLAGDLKRGLVMLGGTPTALPEVGLQVRGHPVELDLLQWGTLFAAAETLDDEVENGGLSIDVDMQVERLKISGAEYSNAALQVTPRAGGWTVAVDHADIAGRLFIDDHPPLRLELARYRIARDEVEAQAPASFWGEEADEPDEWSTWEIHRFPHMKIAVENLFYGNELLGPLSFEMTPEPLGLRFVDIQGVVRNLKFEGATLDWRRDVAGSTSHFVGTLSANNIAEVLESFGYAGSLESKAFKIDADVSWFGSPSYYKLKRLSGSVSLNGRDGRIVQVGGANAVRLLGIFDFAAIARRARLDFSDVFDTGLTYDEINADMRLNSGVVSFAEPLGIVGPGSEVRLGGTVDLTNGTLDNDMIVTLPISNTLPWYAAYAALTNPLAGAGVLVAEQLLSDQIDQFSSAKYRVAGSIETPTVAFVSVFNTSVGLDKESGTASEELANDRAKSLQKPQAAVDSAATAADTVLESEAQSPRTDSQSRISESKTSESEAPQGENETDARVMDDSGRSTTKENELGAASAELSAAPH